MEKRRKNGGSESGHCSSSCEGEKGLFVSGAPTVNPVPVSVHAALPAQCKNHGPHL